MTSSELFYFGRGEREKKPPNFLSVFTSTNGDFPSYRSMRAGLTSFWQAASLCPLLKNQKDNHDKH